MKQSLLNALRKGTAVSIGIDSYPIALIPHPQVAGEGGVYTKPAQDPRAVQNFSFEPLRDSGAPVETNGANLHTWSFYLVGAFDSILEIGDTWQEGATNYEVVSVLPANGYERRGLVNAIGKDPSYGN